MIKTLLLLNDPQTCQIAVPIHPTGAKIGKKLIQLSFPKNPEQNLTRPLPNLQIGFRINVTNTKNPTILWKFRIFVVRKLNIPIYGFTMWHRRTAQCR